MLKGGLLGNTFTKTTFAPVQKNLLLVAAVVDTGHEVTFMKDQSYVWRPGTGRWQHIRRVCGTYEIDTPSLRLTGTDLQQAPVQVMSIGKVWEPSQLRRTAFSMWWGVVPLYALTRNQQERSENVIKWRKEKKYDRDFALGPGLEDHVEAAFGLDERLGDASAREQEFGGDAIPEVDHEPGARAEERAPPMLRNRPIGPPPMEREEHCRTHEPYRAWRHACIADRGLMR